MPGNKSRTLLLKTNLIKIQNSILMLNRILWITLLFAISTNFTAVIVFGKTNIESSKVGLAAAIANPNLKEKLESLRVIYTHCSEEEKFGILPSMVKTYFKLKDFYNAEKYSLVLLEMSEKFRGSWAYGDAIHDSNMVIGLIKLEKGSICKAKQFLLRAGDSPGSYQIKYVGPNMMLAKALLELNEREVVVEYLNKIRTLWIYHNEKLINWIEQIERGKNPNFDGNLAL